MTTEIVEGIITTEEAIEMMEAAELWLAARTRALKHIARNNAPFTLSPRDEERRKWEIEQTEALLAVIELGTAQWTHLDGLQFPRILDSDRAHLELARVILKERDLL